MQDRTHWCTSPGSREGPSDWVEATDYLSASLVAKLDWENLEKYYTDNISFIIKEYQWIIQKHSSMLDINEKHYT